MHKLNANKNKNENWEMKEDFETWVWILYFNSITVLDGFEIRQGVPVTNEDVDGDPNIVHILYTEHQLWQPPE